MNIQALIDEHTAAVKKVSAHNSRLNNYLSLIGNNYQLGDIREAEKYRLLAHDELDLLLDEQIRVIVLTDQLNRASGGDDNGTGS